MDRPQAWAVASAALEDMVAMEPLDSRWPLEVHQGTVHPHQHQDTAMVSSQPSVVGGEERRGDESVNLLTSTLGVSPTNKIMISTKNYENSFVFGKNFNNDLSYFEFTELQYQCGLIYYTNLIRLHARFLKSMSKMQKCSRNA